MKRNTVANIFVIAIAISFFHSCEDQAADNDGTFYVALGKDMGASANSVEQTTDGGYIICGYTSPIEPAVASMLLVKTDDIGDTVWTRTYGDGMASQGWSVRQTADGGYIIAGAIDLGTIDVYLVKTDASGEVLWTRTFGGAGYNDGRSVSQTSDDGYIIVGITQTTPASQYDIWLIKTDAGGDTLWTRTYGGQLSDGGNSVQQTGDEGYIITGWVDRSSMGLSDLAALKTDDAGNIVWLRGFGPASSVNEGLSIQQTSDGGYIATGARGPVGDYDLWVLKMSASGDSLWSKTFGGSGMDFGTSIQQTIDGGFVITGVYTRAGSGDYDLYLLKTDATGDMVWTRIYGGMRTAELGASVQQTSDGGFIIAGLKIYYNGIDREILLIKTDEEGNFD